jgi:hypothetical protein
MYTRILYPVLYKADDVRQHMCGVFRQEMLVDEFWKTKQQEL